MEPRAHSNRPSLRRWVRSAALVGCLLALGLAQARARDSGTLRACRQDAEKYCSSLDRMGGGERACLRQFYINLSKPCQGALDAAAQPAGEGDGNGPAQ
jgi:hypothetical protein